MVLSNFWDSVTSDIIVKVAAGAIIALLSLAFAWMWRVVLRPPKTDETKAVGQITSTETGVQLPTTIYTLIDRFDLLGFLLFIVVIADIVLVFLGRDVGILSTLSTLLLIYWYWSSRS